MRMRRHFFSTVIMGVAGAMALPALAQQEQPADPSQPDRPAASETQQGDPQTQEQQQRQGEQPQPQDERQRAQDPQQRERAEGQQRIMLGVGFAPDDARREGQNLEIAGVMPGSAAAQAGLQRGDTIVSINGQELRSVAELNQIVQQQSIGDTAELVILRNGQQRQMQVTFVAPPRQQGERYESQRPAFEDRRRDSRGWLGVTIDTSDSDDTSDPEDRQGVLIGNVYPAGPAARAGLRNGDQIVRVAGQRVSSHQQLLDILAGTNPGESIELVVASGGQERTVNVLLEDASVFDTGRDEFDRHYTWRDPSGFSSEIPDHDMMLEQHRRFAEQHQRLEELLQEVKRDLEQIKQHLNIRTQPGRTSTPQGRTGGQPQGRTSPQQGRTNR